MEMKINIQVKRKLLYYPVFYGLVLLSPLLIRVYGKEKAFDICESSIGKVIEVIVVDEQR